MASADQLKDALSFVQPCTGGVDMSTITRNCYEWRGFTLCTKPVERKILITNFETETVPRIKR